MSGFWEDGRVLKKPITYEAEAIPSVIYHCGFCKVRINALEDKYGMLYCPNGHRNVKPRDSL